MLGRTLKEKKTLYQTKILITLQNYSKWRQLQQSILVVQQDKSFFWLGRKKKKSLQKDCNFHRNLTQSINLQVQLRTKVVLIHTIRAVRCMATLVPILPVIRSRFIFLMWFEKLKEYSKHFFQLIDTALPMWDLPKLLLDL